MSEIDPNRRMLVLGGDALPSAAMRHLMVQSMLAPLILAAGSQPMIQRPEHPKPHKEPATEIEKWNAEVERKKRAKKESKS